MKKASLTIKGKTTIFPVSDELVELDEIVNKLAGISSDNFPLFDKDAKGNTVIGINRNKKISINVVLEQLSEKEKSHPLLQEFLSKEEVSDDDFGILLHDNDDSLSILLDDQIIEAFEVHENVEVHGHMSFEGRIPSDIELADDIVIKCVVLDENLDSFTIEPVEEFSGEEICNISEFIESELPMFAKLVKNGEANEIVFHTDAFGNDELELLGAAIKYATLNGKNVTVITPQNTEDSQDYEKMSTEELKERIKTACNEEKYELAAKIKLIIDKRNNQ